MLQMGPNLRSGDASGVSSAKERRSKNWESLATNTRTADMRRHSTEGRITFDASRYQTRKYYERQHLNQSHRPVRISEFEDGLLTKNGNSRTSSNACVRRASNEWQRTKSILDDAESRQKWNISNSKSLRALSFSAGASLNLLVELQTSAAASSPDGFDEVFRKHLEECLDHMEKNQGIHNCKIHEDDLPTAGRTSSNKMRCIIFRDYSIESRSDLLKRFSPVLAKLTCHWTVEEATYSDEISKEYCNISNDRLPSAMTVAPDSKHMELFGCLDEDRLLIFLKRAEENHCKDRPPVAKFRVRWFDDVEQANFPLPECEYDVYQQKFQFCFHDEYRHIADISMSLAMDVVKLAECNQKSADLISRSSTVLQKSSELFKITSESRQNFSSFNSPSGSQESQDRSPSGSLPGDPRQIPVSIHEAQLNLNSSSALNVSDLADSKANGVSKPMGPKASSLAPPAAVCIVNINSEESDEKAYIEALSDLNVETLAFCLLRLYRMVKPLKVKDIPQILQNYEGREKELISALFQQYGLQICASIFHQAKQEHIANSTRDFSSSESNIALEPPDAKLLNTLPSPWTILVLKPFPNHEKVLPEIHPSNFSTHGIGDVVANDQDDKIQNGAGESIVSTQIRCQLSESVKQLYEIVKPSGVQDVERIVASFQGREHELIDTLCDQYGADLCMRFFNPRDGN